MIKSIFKYLSGRPKDGDIIECIRPFVFYPQIVVSILGVYYGMKIYPKTHLGSIMFAIISMLLAWQAGWGMSIERFKKSEK